MSHVEPRVGEELASFTTWLRHAYVAVTRTEHMPYKACVHVLDVYKETFEDIGATASASGQTSEESMPMTSESRGKAPTLSIAERQYQRMKELTAAAASSSSVSKARIPSDSFSSLHTVSQSASSPATRPLTSSQCRGEENCHGTIEEPPRAHAQTLLNTKAEVAAKQSLQQEMKQLGIESKIKACRDRFMTPYQQKHTRNLRELVVKAFIRQYLSVNRKGGTVDMRSTDVTCLEGEHMLGCKHYARNCKLYAECCQMYVTCRLCHDEMTLGDHELDRSATKKVLCAVCMKEQPVRKNCIECGVEFAHYFCSICKFYENTPGKEVYHCDRCKICRRGKGLNIDQYHCENCDACISVASKPHHKCKNQSLHTCCPVCCEYLFTSTKPVLFMRCGHTMHRQCFAEYTKRRYQCPYCYKSLTDMTSYFSQIDAMVATETMPPEYSNRKAYIFCNDCEKRSTAKYHYIYLKCQGCGSYNTRLLHYIEGDDT